MRGARMLTLIGVAWVFGTIGGCQSGPDETAAAPPQTEAEWSTKPQSVLGRDESMRRIRIPEPIDPHQAAALRETARSLLVQAADSTNPLLRANAIEALHEAPDLLEPILSTALIDENRGVRFVAAMTVGQLRMDSLVEPVGLLLVDESDSVRAAAIYALRRCGRQVDPSPLADMLMSGDPEVKANAALVVGKLGDPSAVPMLREALHRPLPRTSLARTRIVELQIAEAMVKLGHDKELEVIRAALFARPEEGEIAALACQICGRLKDEAYAASLMEKAIRTGRDQEPAEVRLAAAGALAQIDPTRAPIEVPLAYVGSERFELRAQVALTLGLFRDGSVLPVLATMMGDQNALVQVSAAGSVLKLAGR